VSRKKCMVSDKSCVSCGWMCKTRVKIGLSLETNHLQECEQTRPSYPQSARAPGVNGNPAHTPPMDSSLGWVRRGSLCRGCVGAKTTKAAAELRYPLTPLRVEQAPDSIDGERTTL
jgi:hypothetical protein